MNSVTPDPSQPLALYFRVNASGVPIVFTFTNTDGSAYSFIYDDFQVRIKKYIGDKKNAILMGFGTGLSLTDNVLTLTFTELNSKVEPGEYYWELYKNDYGRPWLTGPAYAIEGVMPIIEQVTDITINEGGYTVNITINEASSSSSGTAEWREWDNTENKFPDSGGSGTAGAVMQSDQYIGSGVGNWETNTGQGSEQVNDGAIFIARVDSPGQTPANWRYIG
jgi:hypothetical protein